MPSVNTARFITNSGENMIRLKRFLAGALLLVNTGVMAEDIVVYRSPTCSCCGRWLEHLKQNRFTIKDIVTNDVQAVKDQYGITPELASCHTAIINGYAIEGHVPAADIDKLLKNKPAVAGISVPGMPVGTPGMEMGGKKDAYDVVSFDRDGNSRVFSRYSGN